MRPLRIAVTTVLLATIMASTAFVTVFAERPEDSAEIVWFSLDIDYRNNQIYIINFSVEGFSFLNEEAFAFSVFDASDAKVLDQNMVEYDYFVDDDGSFVVALYPVEGFYSNPDEIYTLKIYGNSFETADGEKSGVLTYSFLPSDYIYIPTLWETIVSSILIFLHSNPILEFLFARLIVFLEYFQYYPFDVFLPIPLLR
jgi:hypothetical protein